jgi:hypothetical protein
MANFGGFLKIGTRVVHGMTTTTSKFFGDCFAHFLEIISAVPRSEYFPLLVKIAKHINKSRRVRVTR